MTTPVSDLRPGVLAYAASAPAVTIDRVIVEAAREFCRECNAWRADITAFPTVNAQAAYTITPPTGGVLVDIISARITGLGTVEKRTPEQLDAEDYEYRETAGDPKFIYRGGRNEVKFAPIPNSVKSVKMRAAFEPTVAATVLDDRLVDDYAQVIVYGAVAKVLAIPGKSWSDSNLSSYYENLYRSAFADAKTRAINDGSKTSVRVVKYGGL